MQVCKAKREQTGQRLHRDRDGQPASRTYRDKVLETAAGEHTGTARSATGTGTGAHPSLRLLNVDGLSWLRVVALLRLTTVRLLRRRGVVTLLRLAVSLADHRNRPAEGSLFGERQKKTKIKVEMCRQ